MRRLTVALCWPFWPLPWWPGRVRQRDRTTPTTPTTPTTTVTETFAGTHHAQRRADVHLLHGSGRAS